MKARLFIMRGADEEEVREETRAQRMLDALSRGRCPLCGGRAEVLSAVPEIRYLSWVCRECRAFFYSIEE